MHATHHEIQYFFGFQPSVVNGRFRVIALQSDPVLLKPSVTFCPIAMEVGRGCG